MLVARLKEPGRIRRVDLDSEHFPEKHRAGADRRVRCADRTLRIDERGPAAEGGPEKRPDLPVGGVRTCAQ
jgi:hypothetical protein